MGVLGYMLECWVTWWGVGLHGGMLGYMVEVLCYIVGCWVT